jgi:tetratricopeptide (TPR) repeat protein
MSPNKQTRCHLLVLLGVVLAVFGNSLPNGFVYDDLSVKVNKAYRSFDLHALLTPFGTGDEYFPVRDLSVSLDFQLWGDNAFGMHLTNLIIYILSVFAVYFLTKEINYLLSDHKDVLSPARSAHVQLLTAVMFAVHPIHCQVVDAFFNRAALLSGLFFFLSCYFFLRSRRDGSAAMRYYGASLLCFLLAMLSKQYAIILPLMLLLFLLFDKDRKPLGPIVSLGPFFALSAAFFFLFQYIARQTRVVDDSMLDFASTSLGAKLVTALQIPSFYFRKLAVPVGFSVEYDVTFAKTLFSAPVMVPLVAYLALLGAAVLGRRKYPELLFALGWFFIALLPMLHLFPTNPIVADRYAYLASFGFLFLAARWAHRLLCVRRGVPLAVPVCLAVVGWGGVSFAYNFTWKDSKRLWSDVVTKFPTECKGYVNLGAAYMDEGEYRRADGYFDRALAVCPDSAMAYADKGLLYFKTGDLRSAIAAYGKALSFQEDMLKANYGLGSVYELLGDYEKAVFHYNRCLATREFDLAGERLYASTRLPQLLTRLTRLADLRETVAQQPDNLDARGELALKLDTLALYDEALTNYLELERRDKSKWQLYFNIGNVYHRLHDDRLAAESYEKGLALNPRYADAWNNLGVAYKEAGDMTRAIAAFGRAIACDDRNAKPFYNLAMAYYRIGDRPNAVRYLRQTRDRFPEMGALAEARLKTLQ